MMIAWIGLGLGALVTVTGAVTVFWRSQAAQNGSIQDNTADIRALSEARMNIIRGLNVISEDIRAQSERVSQTYAKVERIEAIQSELRVDIREMREELRGAGKE